MASSMTNERSLDAVSFTDFAKGFMFKAFTWKVETLSKRCRSREFEIDGCAGIQWTLAVEKKPPHSRTTIGLYCKEASVLIPAVFRILFYDGAKALLLNRSCFSTFCGGSSGSGFDIENWPTIERRLRMQNGPLTVQLMVEIPKDRHFLASYDYAARPPCRPLRASHDETCRAQFRSIESGGQVPFSDVAILVAKSVPNEVGGDVEKVRCHRLVLCAHSAVFSRMLEKGDFCESVQGVIDVSADIDRSILMAILRYMYCGEVGRDFEEFKVELDDVVSLLNEAEKYGMAGLKSWCESCMIVGYDTDEQRRRQLIVAETFDLKQLRSICVAQLSSDPEPIDEKMFKAGSIVLEEVKQEKERKATAFKHPVKC